MILLLIFVFCDVEMWNVEYTVAAQNPSWPAYNSTINASLDLNVPVSVITNYRSQYCDFWDSIGYIF